MPGSKSMGSTPSSPNRDVSEKFWVPPAVLERKRAHSLVPSLSRHDSDDDPNSGTTTPGSLSGLREMAFTFSNDRVSDGLPPLPSQRPRRASMQDAIDLKKIDTKLYDRRVQNQWSLSSSEEDSYGALNFSLYYNSETHLLAINIIQASDLVPPNLSGNPNPYCKVSLLPHHQSQLQTKVEQNTVNPKYDEEFIFDVLPHKLKSCTLEVLIMNFDQVSKHEAECFGQVKMPLDNVDLSDVAVLWRGIHQMERQNSKEHKSTKDLMFSLSYLSSAERLTVVVIKGRNLRHSDESKATDPFVKVSILHNGKRLKKKKTSTQHGTENPVWNEALTFSLSRDILKDVSIEFVVTHDSKLSNHDTLGRLRLGLESEGDEKIHWHDLLSSKSAVARWHSLS